MSLIALFAVASAAEPPIVGTYATELHVVSVAQVPILGSVKSQGTTAVKMTISAADGGYRIEHDVCDIDIAGKGANMTIPDAFVDHIPLKTYPIDVVPSENGWTFTADMIEFSAGVDATCEVMPESPDDPCVRDFDEDGLPGATIRASLPLFAPIEIYVAQRNHLFLRGTIRTDGSISGLIDVQSSISKVLDANNRLFASSPKTSPVPGASTFRMVKVEDGAGCSTVVAALEKR